MTTVKEARATLERLNTEDAVLQKRADAFIAGIDYFCKTAGVAQTKRAALTSEVLGSLLSASIPYVGTLSNLGSAVGAMATDPRTEEEQEAVRGNAASNLIPGVGSYNLWKRLGRTRTEFEENNPEESSSLVPETIGRTISPLLTGAAGALAGGGLGGRTGAIVGGLGGAVVPALIAALVAASTKTRSREEQEESERTPGYQNMLIPGLAEYNAWKRLGYSDRPSEMGSETQE